MTLPEQHGGLGLGMTELALLLEAAGERLAAIPFWSTTCLAIPLLAAAGETETGNRLLSRLAGGEISATVAGFEMPFRFAAARAAPGGYILSGKFDQVSGLNDAGLILVLAELENQTACFALEPGAGHHAERRATLDATRQIGALTLDGLLVPAEAKVDAHGIARHDLEFVMDTAKLGLAAEEIGAAQGVFDLTLAYVAERVQFGRTISSFQAIKHRCARLQVDLAEARALLYGATTNMTLAKPHDRRCEVAGALVLASDILFSAAEEAVQLHGGVGFTWEYDPHLYLKRAQAGRSLLGGPDRQLEMIATHLLGREALS